MRLVGADRGGGDTTHGRICVGGDEGGLQCGANCRDEGIGGDTLDDDGIGISSIFIFALSSAVLPLRASLEGFDLDVDFVALAPDTIFVSIVKPIIDLASS